MAQIKAHELAYSIEAMITRRLRDRRVVKPGELATELTEKVMDFIPTEAFEPISAWDDGCLFFHGDVDEDSVMDMQVQLTEANINLPKNRPLTIYVSSFGGDCYAGLALCGTIQEIRRQGRVVNCHIQGYAMSMGSVIAQSCDLRSIDDDAWMMVHKVKYGLPRDTKFDDHEDELEATRRLQGTLFGMYHRRTGKAPEWYVKKLHKCDWYLTAAQALEEKLVDVVTAAPPFKSFRRGK